MTYTCRGLEIARSSLVVKFVIFNAILNLGLGFAAALYLGRRYRLLQACSAGPATLPAVATRSVPAAAAPRETAATGPSTTAVAEPSAASVTALRQLHTEVEQYRVQMATIDDQLRQCAVDPQRDTVEACLQELLAATEEYVKKRDTAQRQVRQTAADDSRPDAPYDALDAAIGQETKQIEATAAAVTAFDYQSDLGEGCRQLAEQTDLLLETNLALRNTLAEAADAALDGQAVSPDAHADEEQAAAIRGRAALERALADWCARDLTPSRPAAAALVDLDQFALVNRQHGHGLGDRILKEVAAMLRAERSDQTQVRRVQGNTFLVLLSDTDARSAANFVERFRQTVELTRFRRRETEIRLTLSGAVAELRSGDTPESLLARLKTTLTLAKRYGRNRCFLHEGEYPSPVIPPAFALTEKELLL
jgi:diguanylate cyclase (GGDEF)-like protein